MKNAIRRLGRRTLTLLLALSIILSLALTGAWAVDTTGTYEVTVTPSTEEIQAGDTITLAVTVTHDGEEIADLDSAGLSLSTWLDYYASNGHEDGNSDAAIASPNALSTTVTLPSEGTYYLVTELYNPSNNWAKLASTTTTMSVAAADEDDEPGPSDAVYTVTVTPSQTENVKAGDIVTLTATVTKDGQEISDLTSAGLSLTTWLDDSSENGHGDGNSDAVIASPNALSTTVTLPSEGTYYLVTELYNPSDNWAKLASTTTTMSVAATDEYDEPGPSGTVYNVTVSASQTEGILAGDTVPLTAAVTKDGEPITDLAAEGLYLWWWTDTWAEGHSDGLSDAAYSNYDSNSGHSFTADVTLPSEGTYYIAAELKDSNSRLTIFYTTFSVSAAPVELSDISLENGGFETGDSTNWTLTGFSSVGIDTYAANNTTNTLSLWLSDDEACAGSAAYTVSLTAGTYQFSFELSGAASDSGLRYSVTAGDTELVSGTDTYVTTGWDNWTSYSTDEFTLTEAAEVTFALSGTVPAGYWGNLDNLTLKGTGSVVEEDTSVEADINVDKVQNLSSDFIMGMDISSVISEFNSGVIYYDFDGNKLDNVTDFCQFLASCGVTHVRVRIWNDPYDADGNGYGGGNNDIDTAVKIAQGCKAAGLKLLLDFHCSDFWTDPSKQQAPKAWANYTVSEKADALQVFLKDSLTAIANTGAEIAMVQVGNETTGGFIGETSAANMCTLFNAGAAAIRSFDPTIKVVIHVTNPEKSYMTTWAKNLDTYKVDYDVLATSYYPSWHGTFANLKSQLKAVQSTYGKEVMVAETSYAFTLDETDGHENTLRTGTNDNMMCETQYPFTPQGQASYLRDIIAAVSEAGGLGVFYWESAWITVGDTTGLTGDDYTAQVDANKAIWEQYGSGWASSYSAQYDPDDAGKWYGGSAVDNQAMFYADGSPVASINVWKLVQTGAHSNAVSIDSIEAPQETIDAGDRCTLPETVTVTYSNGAAADPVQWNEADIGAIDTGTPGTYVVNGTVTFSKEVNSGSYAGQTTAAVTYTLTVKAPNLIGDDWSFENGSSNFSGLDSTGKGIDGETPYEGSYCLHWYLADAGTGAVTYNGANGEGITLEPGEYTFECVTQGEVGDTVTLSVLTHGTDDALFTGEPTTLTGWAVWLTPSVTFTLEETTTVDLGMVIGIQAGGWGTIDCMYLYQTGTAETHVHSYGDPVFTWSEDYTTCTAEFTCDCGDVQTVDCTVTIDTINPTETQDGQTVYSAVVTFKGETYTAAPIIISIPATGTPGPDGNEPGDSDDPGQVPDSKPDNNTGDDNSNSDGNTGGDEDTSLGGDTGDDDNSSSNNNTNSSGSGSSSPKKSNSSKKSGGNSNTVKTGDDSNPLLWAGIGTAALVVVLLLVILRKQGKKRNR